MYNSTISKNRTVIFILIEAGWFWCAPHKNKWGENYITKTLFIEFSSLFYFPWLFWTAHQNHPVSINNTDWNNYILIKNADWINKRVVVPILHVAPKMKNYHAMMITIKKNSTKQLLKLIVLSNTYFYFITLIFTL